jgi:predicted nucleotidyltransferase component of viral defense system
MINPATFAANHIRNIQKLGKRDPTLVERTIYAFGLLEAIARTGLPFIFKGGTALLVLLDNPCRFSTDIDIVVAPGVDIEKHLEEAAIIWPFIKMTEQIRNTVANIEKRHFKFAFMSPLTGREQSILLDILFEQDPYTTTIEKSIETELLITEQPAVFVRVPSINCILADKLTAFAPHTSGIPFNNDKEMEIIKQLYDVAALTVVVDNFNEVKSNYHDIVTTELRYRGVDAEPEDALYDAIRTARCVAGRGQYDPGEYLLLKRGITNIRNHIFGESFNGEVAVQRACIVMYLAAAILTNTSALPSLKDDNYYISADIRSDEYKKLGHIKKTDLIAYKYLIEVVEMLS